MQTITQKLSILISYCLRACLISYYKRLELILIIKIILINYLDGF